MKIIHNFKFAIFGRISYTDHFIKELFKNGFPRPVVIVSSDEEYQRDKEILTPHGLYGDLEKLEQEGLCELYKFSNVNNNSVLDLLSSKKCNIGISINCRDIINEKIINFFNHKIFNIHDSYLPNERGGALNSWRILNGINSVGNTVHFLEKGIDTGPIVLRKYSDIKKVNPLPLDYLKTEVKNCEFLLTQFCNILANNGTIPSLPQNNDKSFYFPRLYTKLNGAINWDWDVSEVERFIRAFSHPYEGAYTYYCDSKIHILNAFVEKNYNLGFHPFCNGKIVTNLDNGNVRVVAGKSSLIITEITKSGKKYKPPQKEMSVKYTLYSKQEDLIMSRTFIPSTKKMK